MKNPPTISDYDSVSYDYEKYWEGREYEDAADKIALQKFIKDKRSGIKTKSTYIDIGGSYGREAEVYAPFVKHIILFDYSINSLKKGKSYLEKRGVPNVTYVAGNIYFLPFKDNTIHSGQMVRVMHHLKDPAKAMAEVSRVISYSFILEVANKLHAKFVAKSLLKFNMKELFNNQPMQQSFRPTSQGSSGENQIFLNFPFSYIIPILQSNGFKVVRLLSVSNLRFPILKKTLPLKSLIAMESILQEKLSNLHFGPSMYFLLRKKKTAQDLKYKNIEEIFCCPKCKGDLSKSEEGLKCAKDNLIFKIEDGVYDFRYFEN